MTSRPGTAGGRFEFGFDAYRFLYRNVYRMGRDQLEALNTLHHRSLYRPS